jgi:hypothetical protein
MEDGDGLLLQDRSFVDGIRNGYQGTGGSYRRCSLIGHQYFKLFLAAVAEGRIFLPFFIGHLLAQVTFTVTGQLGLVAVLAEGGGDGLLIERKTDYQPALAEGGPQHQYEQ